MPVHPIRKYDGYLAAANSFARSASSGAEVRAATASPLRPGLARFSRARYLAVCRPDLFSFSCGPGRIFPAGLGTSTGAEAEAAASLTWSPQGYEGRGGRSVASLVTCSGCCRGSIDAGVGDGRADAVRACLHMQADGDRFCPTTDGAPGQTVDGVPRSTGFRSTSTSPCRPRGNGPFPTIVMLHGYGGDKTDFESDRPERRRLEHLPLQQRLLRPPRLRGRQLHRPRLRQLLRRRPGGDHCRRLRPGLHPPGRHALRGARHPVPARPARRPEDRQAATRSA